MYRYRLTIEYDGKPYAGWQRQENRHSVQAALEQAFAGFAGHEVRVFGAGRTDAGVHAIGQVAHVDLEKEWRPGTVRDALNAHLAMAGEAVSALSCERTEPDFHARFSARARHYVYRILDRRAPSPLLAGRVWWVRRPLDAAAMDEAAKLLVGTHDFTTFRSVECQSKSPVKTLDRLDVTRPENDCIEIRASARSFLHNQVRSMVGTLARVGEGAWTGADVARALAARERAACGPVAPPQGLYLLTVDY